MTETGKPGLTNRMERLFEDHWALQSGNPKGKIPMKPGISLSELARQLEERKTKKVDMIVPTSEMSLKAREEIKLYVPGHGETPINEIAHNQLAAFTEVPGRYYDKMLNEAPALLADNINEWLHRDKKSVRLVRQLYGYTRAFLSNRYQRIENEEIAEVALPILLSDPDLTVVSTEITDRRLYIQATTSRVTGDVKVGDPVQAGVIISNSEVGHGSVSVQRVIYRLRCLNGLILPDNKYRANHTGARIDDNEALWKDDTRKAEDKAILLKVRDMVQSAMDPTSFNRQLDKLRETTEQRITGNPAKAIEVLSQKLGVTEGERGGILRSLIEGGDLSRWGVLNAVTHQAHGARDYDRSVEFEQLGSKIIDLPASEWSQVAEAA